MLLRQNFLWVSLSILIICLLYSCKKTEETLPDFTIDKPIENSQWAVNDTIQYRITLNIPHEIRQMKAVVVNQSQIPVTGVSITEVTETNALIQGEHVISSQFIESGQYYFKVSVTDNNSNTVSRYVRIYISEIPLESLALYVVTKQNQQVMNVYRSDSLPQIEQVLTLYTDYSGSDICPIQSYFFMCGHHTGPLAAYDINNEHQLVWKEDALVNPPFPWFESMMYDGKFIVAGYTDHRVKGYFPSGNTSFVFQIDELWPRVFLRHYDAQQQKYYFIIGATHFSGMAHTLSVHYDVSYSNMQYLVTTWEAKKMFSKNDNEIYMFGNDNGQAVMKIYSISQNNTYELKIFPTGKLYDVVRVRPGIFIISHVQGLLMYNYSYNSLTPYGDFQGGGNLEYDAVTDNIFFAQQNSLTFFDFLTQNVNGNINLADSIVRMHILYNK